MSNRFRPLTDMARLFLAVVALSSLTSCVMTSDKFTAVDNFSLRQYLGNWYEIARLDHAFERGLSQVTATYSMRDDGGVRVINRGFNTKTSEWESAEGKAYFIGDATTGALKVSFFGPFYGAYNVVALDHEDYQYSLVAGPSHKYLWILARSPQLESATLDQLLEKARELGFDTGQLIFPEHDEPNT